MTFHHYQVIEGKTVTLIDFAATPAYNIAARKSVE
jgi:hypothetical protein